MEKFGSGIWDKHPGSAILLFTIIKKVVTIGPFICIFYFHIALGSRCGSGLLFTLLHNFYLILNFFPQFLFHVPADTYEAISSMANTCRTEEKRFGFAGTKDRRGRTVQRLSVSFIGAKQLLGRETSARKNVVCFISRIFGEKRLERCAHRKIAKQK